MGEPDVSKRRTCDSRRRPNVPLIPDTDRLALSVLSVGAFVATPLIRDGQLVAALCVSDRSPRVWTSEEVELVRETAQRTWEAIERARAEEQLRDANARKDEFLAMLAHELRNPLAPIRTGLELIRRGGDTKGAVERVRGMMERQVGHMVHLIDDLLDVSRITSGKIALKCEPTPIGRLVHSAVEANRAALAAKQIELSVELPRDPCVLNVDPTRFVQILSNLLHNAAKFTNHGGWVRITAQILDRGLRVRRCRFQWRIRASGLRRSCCLECSICSRKAKPASRNLDSGSASPWHVA